MASDTGDGSTEAPMPSAECAPNQHARATPSQSFKRRAWLFLLLVLAVAPLVPCFFLWGHELWAARWGDVGLAFRFGRPRPGLVDLVNQGPKFIEDAPFGSHFAQMSGSDQAAFAHGVSLAIDELRNWGRLPPGHFYHSALQFDKEGPVYFNSQFWQQVARQANGDDPLLAASRMIEATLPQSNDRSEPALPPIPINPHVGERKTIVGDEHWRVLDEATSRVLNLRRELAINPPPQFFLPGFATKTKSTVGQFDLALPDEEQRYADLIGQFCDLGSVEYLKTPFVARIEPVWRGLGLDARAARASAEQSLVVRTIVGWHVAIHMETLEALADRELANRQFDAFVRWIDLADRFSALVTESGRDSWIGVLAQRGRSELVDLVGEATNDPDCPAQLKGRGASILATSAAAAMPGVSGSLMPAILLDNFSRGSLAIAAVTLVAAVVGRLNRRLLRRADCRSQRETEVAGAREGTACAASNAEPVSASPRAGTMLLAAAAFVLVSAVIAGIEATNDSLTPLLATFVFCLVLSGSAILLFRELVRLRREQFRATVSDADASHDASDGARSRSSAAETNRIRWLVLCFAMLLILRFMVMGFQPSGDDFLRGFKSAMSLVPLMLLGVYAVLRWLRWRRDHDKPPPIHPALLIGVAIVLLVCDFSTQQGGAKAGPSTRSEGQSPTLSEVNEIVGLTVNYEYYYYGALPTIPAGGISSGVDLLSASVAMRMYDFGLWLVVTSGLLAWLVEAWEAHVERLEAGMPVKLAAQVDSREPRVDRTLGLAPWPDRAALACFWLAFVALTVHSWCTLGLYRCVQRMLAR